MDRRRLSWVEVWLEAVFVPTVETYTTIANDQGASLMKALLWVGFGSFVGNVLAVASVAQNVMVNGSRIAFGVLVALMVFVIATGLVHIAARILGGTGSYTGYVYAVAAYLTPLSVVLNVVAAFPALSCLSSGITLYAVFLNLTVIRAVHRIGWGTAIASLIVLPALAGCVIVMFALLGPALQNVISAILNSLATPSP